MPTAINVLRPRKGHMSERMQLRHVTARQVLISPLPCLVSPLAAGAANLLCRGVTPILDVLKARRLGTPRLLDQKQSFFPVSPGGKEGSIKRCGSLVWQLVWVG